MADRILIAGAPKTGTTGLFYKIRNSMPGEPRELFEVATYEPLPDDGETGVVAKVVVGPDTADLPSYAGFDRHVFIVRDPRDTLISSTLYAIGFHRPYDRDDVKVAAMYGRLRTFEQDGEGRSLLDLLTFDRELMGVEAGREAILEQLRANLESVSGFYGSIPGALLYRYEDFVASSFDDLAGYLGFPLEGSGEVDPAHRRVVRTKAAGNWKAWLSESDVEALKPIYDPFLERFGYDTDWRTESNARIDPDTCSEYYFRLVDEKRSWILRRITRDRLRDLLEIQGRTKGKK